MQLVCPNCALSYAVADNALGERGRQVRCVKCKHVWFAKPEEAVTAGAEPAAAAVSAAVHPPVSAPEVEAPPSHGESAPPVYPESPMAGAAVPDTPPEIEHAPSIAPDMAGETSETAAPTGKGKLDYFELRRRRAMRAIARQQRGLGITPGRVAAALLGILVALVYERENIAHVLPQTASFFALAGFHINLRGLAFEDVRTEYETQDGVRVLVVEGELRNVTSNIRPVARLRFSLRNADGAEVYSWTAVPDRSMMAPGEVQPFKSRLASPPTDGKELRVRFFNPRDMAATQSTTGLSAPAVPTVKH